MSTTMNKGPAWTVGNMEYLPGSFGSVLPDYNPDAGPSVNFQGEGVPDVRFFLQKDKLSGFAGVQPVFLSSAGIETVDAVPAAYGTAKIAALQNVTNGTPMTLVSTNSAGITTNVPISPFSGAINGNAIVTAPIVLDFGFAFATTTAGSNIITVPDITQFTVGMPIVMPGAATASTPLLTWVTGFPSAITVQLHDAVGVSIAGFAPIGTGDIWPGAPLSTAAQQYPLGHMPYLAGGPGLFFDPSQGLARGVSVTCNSSAGTGGVIMVVGYDVYWQLMSEQITIAPGTALTAYGKKAFKAIKSVNPKFTDASHTYSIGTSDVFGFNLRARNWERTSGAWAAGFLTGNTGFTPYMAPSSGDVRGTFQVSAIGGGTGYGATASNGVITGRVMTGNRLAIFQSFSVADTLQTTGLSPASWYGATQT